MHIREPRREKATAQGLNHLQIPLTHLTFGIYAYTVSHIPKTQFVFSSAPLALINTLTLPGQDFHSLYKLIHQFFIFPDAAPEPQLHELSSFVWLFCLLP